MASISLPVGIRDMTVPTPSLAKDQQRIIDLLATIPIAQGGLRELLLFEPMRAGASGQCPKELALAILGFQQFWVAQGVFRKADAAVDPGGNTLKKMEALAALNPKPEPPPKPPGPNDTIEFDDMSFEQVNPPAKVAAHEVANKTIEPLSLGSPLLQQGEKRARIHELRFRIKKPGGTFWVGVGVPEGTVQFGQAMLFFHPTPVQAGVIKAADSEYAQFTGGWVKRIEKYMPRNTGQLALARKLPMVLPYMTMASAKMDPKVNVFADRPLETIAGVLAAARRIISGSFNDPPLFALSVGSFSSGITFQAGFLKRVSGSPIIKECVDFDSTFIKSAHETLAPPPGARALVFTQFGGLRGPVPGRFDLPPPRWAKTSFLDLEFHDELPVHNKIGFMLYWASSFMSALTDS